jgi:hypothetical protein
MKSVERRGVGRRLTDGQRVEIIKLFESGAAVTEADIARRYGVTRSAIWRLRRASSQIMERYQEGDIESRDERRRGPSGAASASAAASASSSVSAVASTSAAAVAAMAHNHAIAVTSAAMDSASASAMARGGLLDAGDGQLAPMGEYGAFQGVNMSLARPMAQAVGGHLVPNSGGNEVGVVVMPDGSTLSVVPGVGTQQPTDPTGRKTTPSVTATAEAASTDAALPLVFLSMKAIGSVQSPGIVNWERVNGAHDDEHFEIVNDGLCVQREGNYQINVDLQHSQPRQNFRFTFKVWHGKKLLGQCSCPLRTKKEVSLSVLELRCHLPALAKLRVEFLAPGFAFHESRATIRRLP